MNCPVDCPGCLINQYSYEKIWADKIRYWNNVFTSAEIPVEFIAATEEQQLHYRKKVTLHVSRQEGNIHFGFVKKDRFFPIPSCLLHNENINRILHSLSSCLQSPHMKALPITHVIIHRQQVLLIIKAKKSPDIVETCKKTCQTFYVENNLHGLHLHFNPSAGDKIVQKNVLETLWGERYSKDERGFYYSPLTFTQHQFDMVFNIIDRTILFFSEGKTKKVLDLFCGTGITSYYFQQRDFEVTSIENHPDAVICALKNAPTASILQGRSNDRLRQLILQRLTFEHVYLNPPRDGLDKETLTQLLLLRPKRIAYLSCNPISLKRDISFLNLDGFRVVQFFVYDFFPYTKHLESFVLLER